MPELDGPEQLLGKENLKITKARKMVLEILRDSPPKTAGEIFASVSQKNGRLSLSTVYRTCETMAQKGILLKSNLMDDGVARYEFLKKEHTHHAICLGCGRIFPVDDCPFGEFDRLMRSKYDFAVKSHRIEIYGYCHDCRQNGQSK